jgi:divalent metal cation (Fe/Co/Zn/Cd) transporter
MSSGQILVRTSRASNLRAGVIVEWVTIAWMMVEAAVSLRAGIAASSIALLAFGIDSVIELVSAGALLRRLVLERESTPVDSQRVERAERVASRVVGWSLVALAVYVTLDSGYDLWTHVAPDASLWGMAIAAGAVVVMPILVRVKLRVATSINSAALKSDAMCGVACAYMAGTLLVGLALCAAFGWWWADPVAALGVVYFIVREAREALTDRCECDCIGASTRDPAAP